MQCFWGPAAVDECPWPRVGAMQQPEHGVLQVPWTHTWAWQRMQEHGWVPAQGWEAAQSVCVSVPCTSWGQPTSVTPLWAPIPAAGAILMGVPGA